MEKTCRNCKYTNKAVDSKKCSGCYDMEEHPKFKPKQSKYKELKKEIKELRLKIEKSYTLEDWIEKNKIKPDRNFQETFLNNEWIKPPIPNIDPIKDKTTPFNTNDIKESAEKLFSEKETEQIKIEPEDFELPEYLKSYNYWRRFLTENYYMLSYFWLKKIYATIKLQYIADKLNGDWKPDLNDLNQEKWFFRYKDKQIIYTYNIEYSEGQIFFKNLTIIKKARELMGDDIYYYLEADHDKH